ncbi:uncharacterized protein BXZ73DRAFT_96392 [Epithele typhae]|uniref:uncharacterized protein n=1 Tax=Epithele typhae TaxID=378194 RepID=UPI0020073F5C|nr:uncharacterized protein BXZ73DRAFT_96392 [Epithele typhae]KAH9945401.1 hypothetical protein BXZ73DRAFT_96392 [Epithele typhae]
MAPLKESPDPASPTWATSVDTDYLVFFASRDQEGKMWCPDCRAVEDLVKSTFEPPGTPSATIVWVGQRSDWKTPAAPFRAEPWNVRSVPTIIRRRDGARLVDDEIVERLQEWLSE